MQFQTQLMELKSKNGVDFGPSNCHNELLQQKLPMKHCDETMTQIKVSNFSSSTNCICRNDLKSKCLTVLLKEVTIKQCDKKY